MARKILSLIVLAMMAAGEWVQAEESATPELQPGQPVKAPAADSHKPLLTEHRARAAAFDLAVGEYLAHRDVDDWRVRVGIDRRLLRAAGKLPTEYLAGRLDAAPGNMEVATAVAVCMGEGSKDDPGEYVAGLFFELLGSPIERVRYRAAEAIVQRVQDGTLPPGLEDQLAAILSETLVFEMNQLNAGSMRYAITLLKPDVAEEAK